MVYRNLSLIFYVLATIRIGSKLITEIWEHGEMANRSLTEQETIVQLTSDEWSQFTDWRPGSTLPYLP